MHVRVNIVVLIHVPCTSKYSLGNIYLPYGITFDIHLLSPKSSVPLIDVSVHVLVFDLLLDTTYMFHHQYSKMSICH